MSGFWHLKKTNSTNIKKKKRSSIENMKYLQTDQNCVIQLIDNLLENLCWSTGEVEND